MTKAPAFAFLALLALTTPALAVDEPSPPALAPMSPADAETKAVLAFGTTHQVCTEWTDACVVCLRTTSEAPACSLPGIACLPKDVVCTQPPERK